MTWMRPDRLDCFMSPTAYGLESLDKRAPKIRPVQIMSFTPDTISQWCNPAGVWNWWTCVLLTCFPFTLLKHSFLFIIFFLFSPSHTASSKTRRQLVTTKFDSLHSPCKRLIHLTAINWCSTRFKQQESQTLTVFHCIDLWVHKNRISLSSTIRTGAIKDSSLLLWSCDLYQGIHKQKLDTYCGYRTRPGSYQKHSS